MEYADIGQDEDDHCKVVPSSIPSSASAPDVSENTLAVENVVEGNEAINSCDSNHSDDNHESDTKRQKVNEDDHDTTSTTTNNAVNPETSEIPSTHSRIRNLEHYRPRIFEKIPVHVSRPEVMMKGHTAYLTFATCPF